MLHATKTTEEAEAYVIQGRTVTMPAVVRDASAGNVIYLVPAAAAQALVGDAFEVVEMAPGQTQLILGFVDYRDNDLGDYNEVMIVFMVRPKGSTGSQGTFIYKLPVNQSFTCDAGRTIWGFPKSVEQIDVTYAADHATCTLVMDGQHVFTLTVPRNAAPAETPAADMEMTTYTYLDGPTAVRFTTGGATAVGAGGKGVELSLGPHPLAEQLRALGLPGPAMMSTWIEHMHGTFGAPRPVCVG
jgi:hypothetical protein